SSTHTSLLALHWLMMLVTSAPLVRVHWVPLARTTRTEFAPVAAISRRDWLSRSAYQAWAWLTPRNTKLLPFGSKICDPLTLQPAKAGDTMAAVNAASAVCRNTLGIVRFLIVVPLAAVPGNRRAAHDGYCFPIPITH